MNGQTFGNCQSISVNYKIRGKCIRKYERQLVLTANQLLFVNT
jgi:hypothetical protein